jgi:hypothetical protein
MPTFNKTPQIRTNVICGTYWNILRMELKRV